MNKEELIKKHKKEIKDIDELLDVCLFAMNSDEKKAYYKMRKLHKRFIKELEQLEIYCRNHR